MRHKLPLGEWSRQIHKVGGHQLFTAADIQLMLGEISSGYLAARDLADTLHAKHFKKPNSPFVPLNTIAGVIGQINNMTARLVKPPEKIPTQSLHLRRAELEKIACDMLRHRLPTYMGGEISRTIAYDIIREIWTRGLSLEQSAGVKTMSDENTQMHDDIDRLSARQREASRQQDAAAARTASEAAQRQKAPGMDPRRQSNGIHPAPVEFTEAQLAQDPILRYFHYAHLPATLQPTSAVFCRAALYVAEALPRNAERTVALRKLLEAKDAAVRANVGPPVPTPQRELSFIDRMEIEHKELLDRKHKLGVFLGGAGFNDLPLDHQTLLDDQHRTMTRYANILRKRIEAVKSEAHGQVSSSDNAAGFEDLQDAAPGDGDNVSWPGEAGFYSQISDPTRVAAQLAHNVVTGEEIEEGVRVTGGGKSETPLPFKE